MKLKNFLKAGPKEYQASPKLLSLMEEAKKVFEQGGELVHQDFTDQENRYINIQNGNVVKELDLKQPGELIQVLYSQDGNGSRYEIFDMGDDLNYNGRLIAKVGSDRKTFEYIRKDYGKSFTIGGIKGKILDIFKKQLTNDITKKANIHTLSLEQQGIYDRIMNGLQNTGYDMSKISIIDGRVAVDGMRFVREDGSDRRQTYDSMKNDPKNKTYPQYAEALFEIAGAMIGETRDKPSNRDQINTPDPSSPGKGIVDGAVMVLALSTSKNLKILAKFSEIILCNGYIPLGLDNTGKVIYAIVRSGYIRFDRVDSGVNYCLVPSIEKDTHRGLEHIDQLLTLPGLQPKAQAQLRQIKNTSVTLANNGYDFARIGVKNGLVTIDGLGLPIETKRQTYNAMKADPKKLTHPQYAKSLFDMVGTMIGKTFDYGPDRDDLQKGSIDGDKMIKYLNSKQDNLDILKKLNELIGFNGYIPLGIDNQGKVIYAFVRFDSIRFGRVGDGRDYCLVPSIEGDPHR